MVDEPNLMNETHTINNETDDNLISISLPAAERWSAELSLSTEGYACFIDVIEGGAAALAGIANGDILLQIGFDKIEKRNLEHACRTIWTNKRNAMAMKETMVTVQILPNEQHLAQFAIKPRRGRGDRRRHGHGDQGHETINLADGREFPNRSELKQKSILKKEKRYASQRVTSKDNMYDSSKLYSSAVSLLDRLEKAVKRDQRWRIKCDREKFNVPNDAEIEYYDDGIFEGEHEVTLRFTWREETAGDKKKRIMVENGDYDENGRHVVFQNSDVGYDDGSGDESGDRSGDASGDGSESGRSERSYRSSQSHRSARSERSQRSTKSTKSHRSGKSARSGQSNRTYDR